MRLKNPALILFGAVLVVAIGYLVARWAAKDYERVLQRQASKQFPPVVPDPVLGELKAKMFGAGYEAGRSADLENKPTAETVAEKARLAAKELEIGAEHLDVCIERFKVGFGWGLHDAENVKGDQREEGVGE